MALENVSKNYQFDPIEKQDIITQIGSEYGTLAYMYAKHVYQGIRPLELVPDRLKEDVEFVLQYVEENNLSLIFD